LKNENNYKLMQRDGLNPIRVKLFLCSRDIQVGDEVKILNESWEGIYKAGMDTEYMFKVIGEVSPEAVWVKEGMEFEEDAVQQWWAPEDANTDHYVMKIQCPNCKTFH
jgi:hypothetical protein